MQVLETNEEYKKINEIYTGLMKKKGVKESVSRLDTKEEMDNTFTCIEMFYGNKNQKKLCIDVIKQEYENWIGFWGGIYIQLVIGLTVIVDKIIEWEKKDKEIMEVYINLIKDLRERMQVLETE